MRYGRRALVLGLLAGAAPMRLAAQARSPVTLDASVGGGSGRGGGERANRNATAVDALLAWRARSRASGTPLVGLGGGWQGNFGSDTVCHPDRTGGCMPDFPSLTSMAALVGWEVGGRGRSASARALLGPAYAHAEGARVLGVQSRVDLATPTLFNVALVASVRGAVLPRFRGETLTLGALGLGIRLR